MTWKGRLTSLSVVVAIVINIEDVLSPMIGLPLLVSAVALAWRFTDSFWKTVAFGLVGGAIAGALIMGPGFRVAMRLVAIMEPTRAPEFSAGGTLFIIVGIGGILGGVVGIAGNLIRRALSITSVVVAGVVLAVFEMTLLLTDSGLRQEFFELGAGPWVNIALFGFFALGYGIAAMATAEYLERRTADTSSVVTEIQKVPA